MYKLILSPFKWGEVTVVHVQCTCYIYGHAYVWNFSTRKVHNIHKTILVNFLASLDACAIVNWVDWAVSLLFSWPNNWIPNFIYWIKLHSRPDRYIIKSSLVFFPDWKSLWSGCDLHRAIVTVKHVLKPGPCTCSYWEPQLYRWAHLDHVSWLKKHNKVIHTVSHWYDKETLYCLGNTHNRACMESC